MFDLQPAQGECVSASGTFCSIYDETAGGAWERGGYDGRNSSVATSPTVLCSESGCGTNSINTFASCGPQVRLTAPASLPRMTIASGFRISSLTVPSLVRTCRRAI